MLNEIYSAFGSPFLVSHDDMSSHFITDFSLDSVEMDARLQVILRFVESSPPSPSKSACKRSSLTGKPITATSVAKYEHVTLDKENCRILKITIGGSYLFDAQMAQLWFWW